MHTHTPPNLAVALRLDGDTSSLTICRTCMLTGRQPVVPQGRGSPLLPSHLPQPHPSLAPPQDSCPNPHLDSRLLEILISASRRGGKEPRFCSETWCSLMGGAVLQLAAQKNLIFKSSAPPLSLSSPPHFNTVCLETPCHSQVLRYFLPAFQHTLPDKCFTCFQRCLWST